MATPSERKPPTSNGVQTVKKSSKKIGKADDPHGATTTPVRTKSPDPGSSALGKKKSKKRDIRTTDSKGLFTSFEDSTRNSIEVAPSDGIQGSEEWPWMPLVDPQNSRHPAIFSEDTQYFFLPVASSIKIYSSVTLKLVSTLSPLRVKISEDRPFDGHTNQVTNVVINPQNPLQLYSASLDGTIKLWDWLEGALLRTVSYGRPIYHLCAHPTVPDVVFVAAQSKKSKTKSTSGVPANCRVARVSLASRPSSGGHSANQPAEDKSIATLRPVTGIRVSPSGKWLVVTAGATVHVAPTSGFKKNGFCKFVGPDAALIRCLAFHPTEDYFATGDDRGYVRLWHCLDEQQLSFDKLGIEKKAPTRVFKWHAHAVSTISFTPNGAYLLSGGLESTLVLWHLDTGRKGFISRVGAPILGLSAIDSPNRGQEILLDLADGSLSIYNTSESRFREHSDHTKLSLPALSSPSILSIDPKRSTIALPSFHPASLQLYDPLSSSVHELEVSPSNRISHMDKDSLIASSSVRLSAFDTTGQWLATLDEREATVDASASTYLKLWSYNATTDAYDLHTRIDSPHGADAVTSMEFSTLNTLGGFRLATLGSEGVVKLWGLRQQSNGPAKKEQVWVNRSSLTYRDETASSFSFSPDGSLLAIVHGRVVTLWDAASHLLVRTIGALRFKSVSTIAFVGTCGRYLAVFGSGHDPVLVDLIRFQVTRTIPSILEISLPLPTFAPLVTSIPQSDLFVVVQPFEESSLVVVHNAPEGSILRTRSLPFSIRRCVSLPSKDPAKITLVAISEDGTTYLIGDEIAVADHEGSVERSLAKVEHTRISLFEDVFGRSAFKDLETQAPPQEAPILQTDDIRKVGIDLRLLDGPGYLLPPLETLFNSLMEGVLSRPGQPSVEGSDYALEEDADKNMGIDMEDTSADTLLPGDQRLRPRIVDDQEMAMFVDLFKEHAVIGAPSKVPLSGVTAKPAINGKPNGASHGKNTNGVPLVNGHSKAKKSKGKADGHPTSHLPSPSPTPTPTQAHSNGILHSPKTATKRNPPSPTIGQKRKQPPLTSS